MLRGIPVAGLAIVVSAFLSAEASAQQSFVERNVNAQGVTPPGEYQGIRNMQDNEPSCAINPLLARNFICTWNSSAGSDDEIGDTWVRKSESVDGGASFINQFLNGAPNDTNNSLGLSFAADPVTMCWPGGCGTVFLAANRAPGVFPSGGGIFLQTSVDMNRDVGFRHALSSSVDTVYSSGPGEFADKPFATYILDEENPGTVEVTYEVESPDGGFEIVTREWPRGRIVVAFAVGNPDTNEIKLVSTFTEDYGKTWSIPLELTSRGYWIDSVRVPNKCKKQPGKDECKELLPQGLNQGINMSAIGNDLVYTFRVFEDGENPSAIRGIHSPDKGESVGEPFDIVSPFCAYDVPTLPNSSNTTTAASRTNAFPWISNNGVKHLLVYSERKLSSDGGCFTTFDAPTDSRIKALTLSPDGSSQSAAIEVAPNPGHGFQFQPVVDCSLGSCQVAFWDSRFDSQRVIDYLTNVSTSPMRLEALEAFLNFPLLGDFNFQTGPTTVIQYRRTARVATTKMDISGPLPIALDAPPIVVSQYRKALVDGVVREVERDGFNIKAFRDNFVPFMGDYSWLTSLNLRLVFDSSEPGSEPHWESNRSVDLQNPLKIPQYLIAFVTSRNVKGDIYTARIGDQVPYARTPGTTTARVPRNDDPRTGENPDDARIMHADAVEDSNPGAGFCAPTGNPGPGVIFDAINNLTKDFDIYAAVIEGRASAFTLNPTKTYNIQRASTVVVENESATPKSFRLLIDNQPAGAPEQARASWKQLPFDPALPEFATTPPDIEEFIDVAEFSSESLAVFVVSQQLINPVAIKIFEQLDGGGEVLINTLIVNGVAEDGQFINEDGTLNDFEIHNPFVYYPTVFNPDEYNPDEYNPDEFNPDVYTPDEFNPDEFNPDEFNPDEFNPDEFNPDEFNPDEFNPDEFNPDEFNPDEFNSPLLDPGNLENPDIPPPTPTVTGGDIARLDINFGLKNTGNTTTPYVIDMKYENEEVQDLFTAGLLSATVIGWQDGKYEDSQFCEPREVSVNSILVVDREPDLTTLLIPDINNNRAGEITVWAAPDDVIQILLRVTGPRNLLLEYREELSWVNLSTVFSSQVANTGEVDLITDETILLDNRRPPDFVNFLPVDSTTFEADGPNGVLVPAGFIQAERDGDPVMVACNPALPAQVGLDIFNSPPGPTPFSCTATTGNGVSASLSLDVFVLDTSPPTIDPASVPADITIEADPAGTVVNFATPTATDFNGVDPDVEVVCSPASGSIFPFTSPSLTTPVTCTATDDSLLTDTASFNVTVQDTSAPQFNNFDPPEFEPPLIDKFVLDDDKSTFQLFWGPFEVTDADQMPTVTCNVGVLDPARSDPSLGLYTFVHEFPVGLTNVSCTATDVLGNSTTAGFPVEIFDETAPTITLLGDPEITIEQGDTYVDPGVTVEDNATPTGDIIVDIDTSGVDENSEGTYTVDISATDASGNTANATRTVVVEFTGYPGATGVRPRKLVVNLGSSNAMLWGWLDESGNLIDVTGDTQILRIREGSCSGPVVLEMAGDPGTSGFRFKANKEVQFNWQVEGIVGQLYCAEAQSSETGQSQYSPLMEIK